MINVQFNTVRLEQTLSRALKLGESGRFAERAREAVEEIIDQQNAVIAASGRGGPHNAAFAGQTVQVTESAAGRFNLRAGWLNHGQYRAADGNGLWFSYQDRGFYLYGGPHYVTGVGAGTDQRRERVIIAMRFAAGQYRDDLARAIGGS